MEGEKGVFVLLFFMIVVGLPVIAGVLSDAYKRRLKFRERELELSAHKTAAQIEALRAPRLTGEKVQ